MFILYNLLLIILWPFAAIYMLWRRFGQKKSAAAWWGRVPRDVPAALKSTFPRFWLHAVSVGEVMAARPVARALRKAFPGCGIVISTTTDTGQEAARQGVARGEFDAAFYYPLDFAWTVLRVFRTVQPDAVLLLETELWPNFLHLARRRGIKVFQVNGRVSDNLYQQSARWRRVWQWMMSNITAIFVRSDFDAERLQQMGADAAKVLLTGDVKLDGIDFSQNRTDERQRMRQLLGIDANSLFWIGGSTHDGEEEILLETQRQLQSSSLAKSAMPVRLMIAPRHPERVEAVLQLTREKGFTAIRRSQLDHENPAKDAVIILDTVGELAGFYAAADAAFVGGSLIQRGGHNVLEPVLVGVPVLFGPHMQNFRAAAQLVQDAEVGQCVPSQTQLTQALQRWLGDATQRQQVVHNAEKMLAQHQGATQRVAEGIAEFLK